MLYTVDTLHASGVRSALAMTGSIDRGRNHSGARKYESLGDEGEGPEVAERTTPEPLILQPDFQQVHKGLERQSWSAKTSVSEEWKGTSAQHDAAVLLI